jgi:hypothetical protein
MSRNTWTSGQRLPVGARVRVPFPTTTLDAEVVIDLGFVGVGGRQLVHVRALEDTDLPKDFDVPVEEVEVLSVPPRRRNRRVA